MVSNVCSWDLDIMILGYMRTYHFWYGVKSNITMIAKVCDPESRRDSWFENCLFLVNNSKLCETLFLNVKALTSD